MIQWNMNKQNSIFEIPQGNLQNYIEHLPDKIERAKTNQVYAVHTKYASLLNTVKPLHMLVEKYKRELGNMVDAMKKDNRIDELSRESTCYRLEVNELQKLHDQLYKDYQVRKQEYDAVLKTAKEIRKQLNHVKLDNMEIKLKLAAIKKELVEDKEPQQMSDISYKPDKLDPEYVEYIKVSRQNKELEGQVFNKMQHKIEIHQMLMEYLELMRTKLKREEKVVHDEGLVGSMYLKLCEEKPRLRDRGSKTNISTMGQQLKFLVYDSLKKRYNKAIEKRNKVPLQLQVEKFMKLTPIQMIGLMELKNECFKKLEAIGHMQKKDMVDLVD